VPGKVLALQRLEPPTLLSKHSTAGHVSNLHVATSFLPNELEEQLPHDAISLTLSSKISALPKVFCMQTYASTFSSQRL